jgi:hypothetical protein
MQRIRAALSVHLRAGGQTAVKVFLARVAKTDPTTAECRQFFLIAPGEQSGPVTARGLELYIY